MRRRAAIVAASSLSVLLVGCAPSNQAAIEAQGITQARAEDPVEPTGPGGAVSMEAGDLYFEDQEGTAVDGEVTFTIDNVGGLHNIVIDQAAGDQQKIDLPAGEETTGSLLLYGAPGDGAEYTYYCDIPGHRTAGMEGTITVFLEETDDSSFASDDEES